MEKQTLIFDLDDTLIHCNKYFRATINTFVSTMQQWFSTLPADEIKEKQLQIDLESIEQHGLHSSRFPESLVSTYKFFCEKQKKEIKETEIEEIRKIGVSVFEIEVQPFPYMYEVLSTLQNEGHELYLFTGGDEENQSRKVVQLELETYFGNRVFIFEHKNTEALQTVLQTIRSNPKQTWMIGNSLKTDIKPAVELGIHAIHIPSELEWSYNQIKLDIDPTGELITLNSLTQVPTLIKQYAKEDKAL